MPPLAKRIRQRFGISAPRMAVRSELAWHWRLILIVVAAAVSLALAVWMYDAGRRFAGFDRGEVSEEIEHLRDEVARLDRENARLREAADGGDAKLKIEQTAGVQLAGQVKSLEEENRRLKEDLAFFENFAPTSGKLEINRFTVQPDVLPGEYRYRLLVVLGGAKRERQFQGSLQLVLNLEDHGHDGMIVVPDAAGSSNFRLNFKYFQRMEGIFRVPREARLRSVQARVLESGSNQALATQSVDLS